MSRLILPVSVSNLSTPRPCPGHRVVLHFDLDCFYAQVEMIRNPALRLVPLGKSGCSNVIVVAMQYAIIFIDESPKDIHSLLSLFVSSGIQQKYIIVTCNYVAREMGVSKLMSVTNAKEKCPQLVLVKGEDLTHYREFSYKVTGKSGFLTETGRHHII